MENLRVRGRAGGDTRIRDDRNMTLSPFMGPAGKGEGKGIGSYQGEISQGKGVGKGKAGLLSLRSRGTDTRVT